MDDNRPPNLAKLWATPPPTRIERLGGAIGPNRCRAWPTLTWGWEARERGDRRSWNHPAFASCSACGLVGKADLEMSPMARADELCRFGPDLFQWNMVFLTTTVLAELGCLHAVHRLREMRS